MPEPRGLPPSRFAATFPERFAAAIADARGTMAGITSSARDEDGVLDATTLARLHEVYRLRVELEIETAGVLWRTAEVVCAMADAIAVLGRRRASARNGAAPELGVVRAEEVEGRRVAAGIAGHPARRRARVRALDGGRAGEGAEAA